MNARALLVYFCLTPAFWILDAWLGWTFRIAGLESFTARSLYYSGLLVGAGLIAWRPGLSRLLALLEPAVNVSILFISVGAGILLTPEAAWQGQDPQLLTGMRLVNFLLNGGLLIFAVHQSVVGLKA